MNDPVDRGVARSSTPATRTSNFSEIAGPANAGALLTADSELRSQDTQIRSPFKDAVRRFSKNWAAVLSLSVVFLLIVAAIFAHLLHTSDPTALDYNALGVGPSPDHWFGTDTEGRDEYSRILYGLRIPFMVAFAGTVVTVVLGLAFGLTAGYYGGFIDSAISRFTDFMFAFPSFLLTVIIVTLYGASFDQLFPGGVGRAIILTVVFALVSWPPLMRFIRSLALSLKEQQFVEAARTVGTSGPKIILRHLVPNVWGLVLVQAALTIAYIIGAEAVLSILGLGVNEPTPDLGAMLIDGQSYADSNIWGLFFPCLFLTVLIVAFTFIGDGVRDAVDPRAQR
ncbi:MAG: ABC transporter permease [Mycobacterium sp.]